MLIQNQNIQPIALRSSSKQVSLVIQDGKPLRQISFDKIKQPIIKLDLTSKPTSSSQIQFQQPKDLKGRAFGFSLLFMQIGFMIAYGLDGSFYQQQNINSTSYGQIYAGVIFAMLVIIGCGLLLSVYQFGSWLGITTAIIVVAISIEIGPLLQKLWFSVIITKFSSVNLSNTVALNVKNYWAHLGQKSIQISSSINRNILLSCLSIMIVMTAIIGRSSLAQILKITAFFQVIWNLNYSLLIYLSVIGQPGGTSSTAYLFDQFGSTYTYLFASIFGLVLTRMLHHQKFSSNHPRNLYSRKTLIMSLLGAIFIFASFFFSYSNVMDYIPRGKNLGFFNVFWGILGSIGGTYMTSLIYNKGRVGVRQLISGVINGGVILSGASCILHNIGIVIMLGLISGVASTFFIHKILVKINKTNVYDAMGMLIPFLFSSLLSSALILPASLSYYYHNQKPGPGIDTTFSQNIIGWQLVYVAITIGLGLAGGLLTGATCCCDKQYFGLASNGRIYENNFGLYTAEELQLDLQHPNGMFYFNQNMKSQAGITQIPISSTNMKIQ